jgi:hypothetical protein
MLIGPNLIHLMLPLTSVPTPGKNNATSKIRDSIKNNQSNFLKKSDGISRKKQKIMKPIEIKMACLEAKKKGLS